MEFVDDAASREEDPSDDSEEEEEPTCCSYALTGKTPMIQGVYRCLTCTTEAESNKCCCAGCAETCHWEHDVEYIGYGMSYCDCGEAACELFGSSREVAQKILGAVGSSEVSHEPSGRISGSSASGLRISDFAEFTWGAVRDGDVRRALEEHAAALVRFSKETFWLGAGQAPRCILEAVASQVFQRHTRGVALDPSRSHGAEWWVQVKPCSSVAADGALSGDTASAIDLHYDKDELLAERFSVGVYPQISTVTYLTCGNLTDSPTHISDGEAYSNTAPTIIVDNTTAHPIGRPMSRAFLSRPAVGKHIAFDGLYLHGVPSHPALRRLRSTKEGSGDGDSGRAEEEQLHAVQESLRELKEDAEQQQLRITILVNIWIGHRPAAVEPLSDDVIGFLPEVLEGVLERLCPPEGSSTAEKEDIALVRDLPVVTVYRNPPAPSAQPQPADTNPDAPMTAAVVVGDDTGEWLKLPFVSSDATWGKEDDEDADLVLKMWLPDISAALGRQEDSVRIEYVNNTAPSRSPSGGGKKKKRGAREERAEPLLFLGYE